MEKIKEKLIALFDDMFPEVRAFRHKTYQGIFEKGYEAHKSVISDIAALCAEASEEERGEIIETLAEVLPSYAEGKLSEVPKSKRERIYVDYNMNMAVYVMPVLIYTKDENCMKIAERTVELWNERKVTSLTLGLAPYEEIADGFKKGLFCYITTAVCEHVGLPDDCYELNVLRDYRDHYLCATPEGKALVEEYYETAPALVRILNMRKDADSIYRELYRSYISPCVGYIEQDRNEECRSLYTDMVRGLRKKYLYS